MNLLNETEKHRERAHKLIPAGAHTYSRADNQFPANAPAFVSKAKGCRFWDDNGKEYIDYNMGVLAVSLGHAHDEINKKVKESIDNGTCFSRPSLLEGELAELFNSLVPSAEMVKFAKNGSDVTAAAIRLARHYTKKKYIVRCNQHPFHSFYDWFIASTSRPGGIPSEVADWVLRFDFNDLSSLENLFKKHPDEIACVIFEPAAAQLPEYGFLQKVKDLCEKHGSLVIFDEIITGFRLDLPGCQTLYNVTPHLSTFGKGIGNGYPIGVLCGQKEIMKHGDMNGDVFLLSCTFGGETVGLSATIATINFMIDNKVPEHLAKYGDGLIKNFRELALKHKIAEQVQIVGHPARPEMRFEEEGKYSFPLKTLFMQEMVKEGILMERVALSFSHSETELAKTTEALDKTFEVLASGIKERTVSDLIEGSVVEPVFTK